MQALKRSEDMGNEELFNASKSAYTMYAGFFNDVAQEIGIEKALSLSSKFGERNGASLVETLKEQKAKGGVDLEEIANNIVTEYTSSGFDVKTEVGPEKMVFRTSKCPIYAGYIDAGIDHNTIKSICEANVAASEQNLKKYMPGASVKVNVRATPDATCVEEFHIPE
jgi:predicted ArsR family transcriptional regulator